MDFMSKHIHFRKKGGAAMRLFTNGKLRGNSLQPEEGLKPKTAADRSRSYDHTGIHHQLHHQQQLQQEQEQQLQQQQQDKLTRSVSYNNWKHFYNREYENDNNWTVEDQVYYNVEKQILKAKAEARTVSVIDGDLYIDYQYICPLPYGLRV